MKYQIRDKVRVVKPNHILDGLVVEIVNYKVEDFSLRTYEVMREGDNKRYVLREEWCVPNF